MSQSIELVIVPAAREHHRLVDEPGGPVPLVREPDLSCLDEAGPGHYALVLGAFRFDRHDPYKALVTQLLVERDPR